jgi:hypothetical protein
VNVREPASAATFTPPVLSLGIAPELAALALLEAALEVTRAALAAAHPELLSPGDFEPSCAPAEVACRLIEQALALCGTIHRYRIVLVLDPGPDGPIPF